MSDVPQKLVAGIEPGPRPSWCSGALLVVDRDKYRDFARNGVIWKTRIDDIPVDRKGDARVSCGSEEMAIEKGGRLYGYGLCSSCAAMEAAQRSELRARQGQR